MVVNISLAQRVVHPPSRARTCVCPVDAHHCDAIAGFACVDEIMLQHNLCTARQLPSRCCFWKLLDDHTLVVDKLAAAIHGGENVVVVVAGGDGRASGGA